MRPLEVELTMIVSTLNVSPYLAIFFSGIFVLHIVAMDHRLFGSNRSASAEVVRASPMGASYNNRGRLLTQRDRRMLSTALGKLLGSGASIFF